MSDWSAIVVLLIANYVVLVPFVVAIAVTEDRSDGVHIRHLVYGICWPIIVALYLLKTPARATKWLIAVFRRGW